MRRLWATLLSLWVMLAIVAVLAWSRPPVPQGVPQTAATTLIVKGKNGTTQRLVVLGSATGAAPHATTQTSPPPVG